MVGPSWRRCRDKWGGYSPWQNVKTRKTKHKLETDREAVSSGIESRTQQRSLSHFCSFRIQFWPGLIPFIQLAMLTESLRLALIGRYTSILSAKQWEEVFFFLNQHTGPCRAPRGNGGADEVLFLTYKVVRGQAPSYMDKLRQPDHRCKPL